MLNPADYRHHLNGFGLSDAEKDDYILMLAGVLDGVIDTIFETSAKSAQSVDKSSNKALTAPKESPDMVQSKQYLTELFEECVREATLDEADDDRSD
jgi:hypothetical protein